MITPPTPEEIMERFESGQFAYVLNVNQHPMTAHRVGCSYGTCEPFKHPWRPWWAVPVDWEPWQIRGYLSQLGITRQLHLCEHCCPDRRHADPSLCTGNPDQHRRRSDP